MTQEGGLETKLSKVLLSVRVTFRFFNFLVGLKYKIIEGTVRGWLVASAILIKHNSTACRVKEGKVR